MPGIRIYADICTGFEEHDLGISSEDLPLVESPSYTFVLILRRKKWSETTKTKIKCGHPRTFTHTFLQEHSDKTNMVVSIKASKNIWLLMEKIWIKCNIGSISMDLRFSALEKIHKFQKSLASIRIKQSNCKTICSNLWFKLLVMNCAVLLPITSLTSEGGAEPERKLSIYWSICAPNSPLVPNCE